MGSFSNIQRGNLRDSTEVKRAQHEEKSNDTSHVVRHTILMSKYARL